LTRKFTTLTAIAAPLPLANVDTDRILAGQFLKTISREGLGPKLFSTLRYADGWEAPEFILNREPWRRAGILVTLDNFGCGSSREHAVWALADFGIRCLIAPSFADIFHNNCLKYGVLPITLNRRQVDRLMRDAADPALATLQIDLKEQTIRCGGGTVIRFGIAPEPKQALLLGLDEIASTLQSSTKIEQWESSNPPIGLLVPMNVGDLAAAKLEMCART
jgi:3-isopropylmalate/(R)-2-methylmalate dehydratase small subunit